MAEGRVRGGGDVEDRREIGGGGWREGWKRSEVSRSGLEIKSLGFFSLFTFLTPKCENNCQGSDAPRLRFHLSTLIYFSPKATGHGLMMGCT